MFVITPCPQCGGDIEFLEDAHAIRCHYCGSLLQLVGTEGIRYYYLKPRSTKDEITQLLAKGLIQKKGLRPTAVNPQLVFYPYWWVKGMVFKWLLGKKNIPSTLSDLPPSWERFKELKTHLLDHTFPANQEIPLGPPSLGVRTAALKVRAFNKKEMEHWGLPLKTNVPHSQAIAHAEGLKGSVLKVSRNLKSDYSLSSSSSITVEMEKTGLIGEHYSLIFAPIWIVSVSLAQGKTDFLVDGLSHAVIRKPKSETEKLTTSLTPDNLGFEQGDLSFIPFRCPVCGWDFPFRPSNVVNLCPTCGRAWREKDGSYLEVPYKVVRKKEERKHIIYLPFWTFNVSVTTPERKITTVDQFYQLFPPPRLIKPEKEKNRAVKFYIPAFRIKSIPRVNKFAALFTQNQPDLEYLEDYQKKEAVLNNTVGNVFLNPSESQEMAEIVLYSLIPTNSRKAKKFVSQAQLFFSEQQLEWHSFQETHYDFREENTGYAFQKKAIEL